MATTGISGDQVLNQLYILGLAALLEGCASVAEPLPPDGQAPTARRAAGKPDAKSMRMRIATAIEEHVMFRTLLDGGAPRLLDAKIAGPLQGRQHKGEYCVSIRFETFGTRTAYVSEEATADGGSVLNVAVQTGAEPGLFSLLNAETEECRTGYRPFPELEQLRDKRRAAKGLPT